MIIVLNKFEPCPAGFVEVDTTSHSSFKDLSPFYLGPYQWCDASYGNMFCKNFENLWQYSKVYKQHANFWPGLENSVFSYEPTKAYYQWRDQGFIKVKATRYPMGKGAWHSICQTGIH